MPIRAFLPGQAFEPDTIAIMSRVFDSACDSLRLRKTADDPATRLVAQKIIELAQRGVCDHTELLKRTLEAF